MPFLLSFTCTPPHLNTEPGLAQEAIRSPNTPLGHFGWEIFAEAVTLHQIQILSELTLHSQVHNGPGALRGVQDAAGLWGPLPPPSPSLTTSRRRAGRGRTEEDPSAPGEISQERSRKQRLVGLILLCLTTRGWQISVLDSDAEVCVSDSEPLSGFEPSPSVTAAPSTLAVVEQRQKLLASGLCWKKGLLRAASVPPPTFCISSQSHPSHTEGLIGAGSPPVLHFAHTATACSAQSTARFLFLDRSQEASSPQGTLARETEPVNPLVF